MFALSRFVWALDYPTRPVHVITGYPPGAGPDVIGRFAAQWLSQRLNQQFIVDIAQAKRTAKQKAKEVLCWMRNDDGAMTTTTVKVIKITEGAFFVPSWSTQTITPAFETGTTIQALTPSDTDVDKQIDSGKYDEDEEVLAG